MAFQISPGVNVSEKDLTTIVPSVATTSAGMAGLFEWGPVDQPVLISSVQELGALYGMPSDANYEWWFTAYNFLGYGNNLKIVRHVDKDTAKNSTASTLSGTLVRNVEEAQSKVAEATTGVIVGRYPGSLGNSLRVEMCGGLSAAAAATNFNGWAYKSYFSGIPTQSDYAFRSGLTTQDAFHMVVIDVDGLLSGATGTVLERYESLSTISGAVNPDGTPSYYKSKINSDSRYISCLGVTGVSNLTTSYTTQGTAPTDTNLSTNAMGVASASYAGGTGEFSGVASILGTTGSGYEMFKDADHIDVALLLGGPLSATGAKNLCDLAKSRMDCVAFVSSPNKNPSDSSSTKISTCKTLRDNVGNNNYAFIDSGYKFMYDPFNDVNRWVPMNGDTAGLCVRTDNTNDPWYSPAGFNRGQVRGTIKLAFNPNKAERDEIYGYGINPVVTFSGEGTILFGDKTAQTRPSAFDRINVRRLFIVLEKAIAKAAKYSLFEFNDAFTRAQFRGLVEPFLRDVQARRGIVDFKVVCDEKNNTPQVIDSNQFVADIYVKPNRSINYIQLNFVATKTGVSFEEVGA
jgi:hypothetical protein